MSKNNWLAVQNGTLLNLNHVAKIFVAHNPDGMYRNTIYVRARLGVALPTENSDDGYVEICKFRFVHEEDEDGNTVRNESYTKAFAEARSVMIALANNLEAMVGKYQGEKGGNR